MAYKKFFLKNELANCAEVVSGYEYIDTYKIKITKTGIRVLTRKINNIYTAPIKENYSFTGVIITDSTATSSSGGTKIEIGEIYQEQDSDVNIWPVYEEFINNLHLPDLNNPVQCDKYFIGINGIAHRVERIWYGVDNKAVQVYGVKYEDPNALYKAYIQRAGGKNYEIKFKKGSTWYDWINLSGNDTIVEDLGMRENNSSQTASFVSMCGGGHTLSDSNHNSFPITTKIIENEQYYEEE